MLGTLHEARGQGIRFDVANYGQILSDIGDRFCFVAILVDVTMPTSVGTAPKTQCVRGTKPPEIVAHRIVLVITGPDSLVPMGIHQTIRTDPNVIDHTPFFHQSDEVIERRRRRKQKLAICATVKNVMYAVLFKDPWFSWHN